MANQYTYKHCSSKRNPSIFYNREIITNDLVSPLFATVILTTQSWVFF